MHDDDTRRAPHGAATRFSGLASDYVRARPGYPPEALATILDGLPEAPLVADVGCGTGISTRALAAAGATVIGVEPNRDMIDAAASAPSDRISWRCAAAESTGLDDDSVDAVVAAQAFHWFDQEAALAEFERILRPGGRVALVWNLRMETDPVTRAYQQFVTGLQVSLDPLARDARAALARALERSSRFHGYRERWFENPQEFDEESLLGRARSASYFPRDEPLRSEMEAALRTLHRTHQRDGRVVLAQRTLVACAECGRP